ncbi:Cullin-associated NEDD8-dissociated protein 1,related [Neospora caninum Liverpool]|uniref:Cullin-associated NEDD8-dissociated protein 1,related n=1 Tax=Neospora caninum (strain Liverpool) TaxID=572307 RepID=F0VL28_NEOCL|nr:Cullin-associated NEDD8-dissociated protein 1,related [Neospora caninum Liverpool]CBZ54780.1 Cullin-associated NEDD8-dissociated protein 1,related [Neospora caninum Liverpool]|eukprot:XP_003884808.1 Cullin-associated NEDD8-dissociated protein 1,related [Neospora caninum Liverpool]
MAASDVTALVLDSRVDLDAAAQDQIVRALLRQLEDSSVDVQGNAAKCLSKFTSRLTEENVASVLTQLVRSALDSNNPVRDIYAACLKGAIGELPQAAASVFAISVLPELTRSLASAARQPRGVEEEALELLSEALRRFRDRKGIWSRAGSDLLLALLEILRSPMFPASVKKKAATALGPFAVVLPAVSRQSLFRRLLAEVSSSAASLRFSAQAIGHVVRHLDAASLAPYVDEMTALFFSLITKNVPPCEEREKKENDADARKGTEPGAVPPGFDAAAYSSDAQHELVELCLGALEAFLLRCPEKMTPYLDLLDNLLHRLLTYFPNCYYTEDADTAIDAEEACFEDDALGYERDFDFNDDDEDDDTSWRVRKGAMKVLKTEVQAFPERQDVYYGKFLPVLLRAVNGRDETPEEALETVDEMLRATLRSRAFGLNPAPFSPASPAGEKRESPEEELSGEREGRDGRRALKRMKVTGKPLDRALPSIVSAVARRLAGSKATTRLASLRLLHDALFAAPGSAPRCLASCAPLLVACLTDAANGSAVRLAALHVVAASLLSGLDSRDSSGFPPSRVAPFSRERGSVRGGRHFGVLVSTSLASVASLLGDATGARNAGFPAAREGSEVVLQSTKAGLVALLEHLVDPRLASQISPQFCAETPEGDGAEGADARLLRGASEKPKARRSTHGMLGGFSHPHSLRGEGGKTQAAETNGDSGDEVEEEWVAPRDGWAAKIDFLLETLPEVLKLTQEGLFEITAQALLVTGYAIAFLRVASDAGAEGSGDARIAAVLPGVVVQALAALRDSLRRTDIDQEVKQASLISFGFVVAAGGGFPEARTHLGAAWPLFTARLKNEVTRQKGLEALEVVLLSRFRVDLSPFANELVSVLGAFLSFQQPRGGRQTCLEILSALALLYDSHLSREVLTAMISELALQLTPTDLPFAEGFLLLLRNSLRMQPALTARLVCERVLPCVLLLLRSPLVQGPALTASLHCVFVSLSHFDGFDKERFFQELGDSRAALAAATEAEKTHLTRADPRSGLHAPSLTAFASLSPAALTVVSALAQCRAVVVAAAGDSQFTQLKVEQELEVKRRARARKRGKRARRGIAQERDAKKRDRGKRTRLCWVGEKGWQRRGRRAKEKALLGSATVQEPIASLL